MSELDEIDQLNEDIKRLRVSYEQYFAGVERIEPLKDRDQVKKLLRRLVTARTNNTAFKFRVQSAQATFVTYEHYWDRIARQIEEGTFKRDKLKAKKLLDVLDDQATPVSGASAAVAASPGAKATPAAAATPVAAAAQAATQPAASTRPGAPAAAVPESLRKLHEAYTQARAQLGDTRPVPIETLAETVRKQITMVKQQFGCERVEFKVAVKDGKAILKAIPK